MNGLTEKERFFLDHLEFENLTAGEGIPKAFPARNWLRDHRVFEDEIYILISIRSWERRTLMHELPEQPFEPPWKDGNEARQRSRELGPVLKAMEEEGQA